jgi:hypothetical protein
MDAMVLEADPIFFIDRPPAGRGPAAGRPRLADRVAFR